MHSITGVPLIHLDKMYWGKNWSEPSRELWRERVSKLVERKEWIMDGNYGESIDLRVPHADVIIHLKANRFLAIYRVLKRFVLYYGKVRDDMGEGCQEKVDFEFLKYVWRFNSHQEKRIESAILKYSKDNCCLLYTSPSPRDKRQSRMPSSA